MPFSLIPKLILPSLTDLLTERFSTYRVHPFLLWSRGQLTYGETDALATQLCQRLREAGISEEAIASVHTPIGTPIRAVTPEEIAVSIAGELIYERACRWDAAAEKPSKE